MRRDVPTIRPAAPTPLGDAEWFAQSAGRTRATLRGANHQSAIRNHQSQAVYEYDVYGQVAASDPNHPNRFLFTGREFDKETGLYYYRARYYNPTIGRFLQTDPIGYADGMNMYVYCQNSPLNWIDPSGLTIWGLLIREDPEDGSKLFFEWTEVEDEDLELNYHIYDWDFMVCCEDDENGALEDAIESLWGLPTGKKLVSAVKASKVWINICPLQGQGSYLPDERTISWDPYWAPVNHVYTMDGVVEEETPAFITLGHEMVHAYDYIVDPDPPDNPYEAEASAVGMELTVVYTIKGRKVWTTSYNCRGKPISENALRLETGLHRRVDPTMVVELVPW